MIIHKWQLDLLNGLSKNKEIKIGMVAGRNVGKSVFSSAAFKRLWDDIYKERPVEDLTLTEARLHGSKYYCVEPVGGNWKDMELWVHQTFGEPGEIWPSQDFTWPENPRWCMNNRKFWFRNEADRTLFVMKWR